MNKKPKRIRALRSFINADNSVYSRSWAGATEPCYIIRQSDIRALAEQMCVDNLNCGLRWDRSMLFALRRAGMTPGKGAKS